MSRSTDRLFFCRTPLIGALAMIVLTAGVLAGCALGTPAAIANIRYDLGPVTPAASPGPLPPFKVLDVGAPQMLDSDGLIYRLSYADTQRTATYANSHWTMPPAQLLTQRLRAALSSHGTVLTGGDGV
ncbi:MAG TPA: ABC-type transport auxiliary lipoprotein family protein, partial [Trinickia sp.]|nr:ABC-type transport auxiliary lipoprotein family protein [Trinickia sp.]